MFRRGGRLGTGKIPDGIWLGGSWIQSSWFWSTLVRTHGGLRAACLRRSHDRISQRLQPNRTSHAPTLGMVSHAHVWLPRMAHWTVRGARALCCSHTLCGTGCALAQAAGVVLRRPSLFQRDRPHGGYDFRTNCRFRYVSTSGAGILFVAPSVHRVGLAHGAAGKDGVWRAASGSRVERDSLAKGCMNAAESQDHEA